MIPPENNHSMFPTCKHKWSISLRTHQDRYHWIEVRRCRRCNMRIQDRYSIEECNLLAEKFDFTGGQIDNIVKKSDMSEIINGKQPLINEIIEFCKEELINKDNRAKIGFKIN